MTAPTVLHVGKYFPPCAGGMEVFLADLIAEQRSQGINAHALVHGDPLPDFPHPCVEMLSECSIGQNLAARDPALSQVEREAVRVNLDLGFLGHGIMRRRQ